jgi:outer membrane protein assembly factor BamB
MIRSTVLTALIAIFTTSSWAKAADWPRFAGPRGDCTAPDTGLMEEWPAEGPRELWKVSVGRGFGGVAVKDGEVYILDRELGKSDILRCLDLAGGEEKWRISYDAPGKISVPGSRSHPAVDDKYVFIFSPFGELRCVDRKARKVVWTKTTMTEYQAEKPTWAFTQCPLLHADNVIVAPVGRKATAVAFNRDTGEVAWESGKVSGHAGYASPMLANIGGVDQVLILTTTSTAGLDAGSGTILWSTDAWQCKIPIASPVHLKDGLVFVTGGYGAGCAMFQVTKNKAGFDVSTVFKNMNCNCQIHQPVLYKDHLYLNGNDKSKKHGFICIDLKGNLRWRTERSPGFDWGGVLLADDMIYTVDGTTGDLCMVKPDPFGYKEAGRARFLSGQQIWGTIAMADGKILLRDQSQLKCVDVRGKR